MINFPRDVSHSGKALMALLALLCFMWQVSQSIATGSFGSALLLGAVIAALGVAGKILSDWRSGVYFFLTWLLFEDLIRKYMGNNMYVYFGKDLLVAVIYVSFIMSRVDRDTEPFRPPFKYVLGLFFLMGLVQVFNPGSPSIFYGLLGLKLYFYYIPLMFVGYALMRTERDLRRFLVLNMGLAAVIASVGIIQSIVGLNFLNPRTGSDIDGLSHLTRYTPSGLAVTRPPSVFVSDGRFTLYLILAFILGLGTVGYLLLKGGRGRKFAFPAVALIGMAGVVSGARGLFVYLIASALVLPAGMLWGAPPGLSAAYRLVKAIRRSFVLVALILSLGVILFPSVIGARWAFYQETLSPYSADSELGARVYDYPTQEFLKAFSDRDWIIGHGVGTKSLGGQYVTRIFDTSGTGVLTENGYGNLVLEFGILGPILWVILSLSLLFEATKVTLKLKGTWGFPVAFSISWFAFLLLFPFTWGGLTAYQNFVNNAYFWLMMGIIFRLPDLVGIPVQDERSTVTFRYSRASARTRGQRQPTS